jgi:hypothetical protein
LLMIKANRVLGGRTVIPLEEDADEEQRLDALRKFHEAKTATQAGSHYLEAQQRVHGRLVAGRGPKPGGRPADDTRAWTQSNTQGPSFRQSHVLGPVRDQAPAQHVETALRGLGVYGGTAASTA